MDHTVTLEKKKEKKLSHCNSRAHFLYKMRRLKRGFGLKFYEGRYFGGGFIVRKGH